MKSMLALVGKELHLYFISPIAYVVAMVFLAVSDFLFYLQIQLFSDLSMQMMQMQGSEPLLNVHEAVFLPTFKNMSFILLLIMPLLTMRLFAEEKKGRTAELLMTSPITITQIILGKFIASMTVYATLLLLSLHLPLLLSVWVEVYWQPLFASYLGLFLLGGVFIAMGLFASALTENQIIAAVISFGILIVLWVVGVAGAGGHNSGDLLGIVLGYISLSQHLDGFVKGLVSTRSLTYFISMTLLGLFMTYRVVESERWT